MELNSVIDKIQGSFPDHFLEKTEFANQATVHVRSEAILDVLNLLRTEGFNFLSDITAVDLLHLGGRERFVVVYHLLSHKFGKRLTVKAYVNEGKCSLPSVVSVWDTANWQEREVYDLFGITFEGHPNLIRILNPDYLIGHPLRKDYPRMGYGERKSFPVLERTMGLRSRKDE